MKLHSVVPNSTLAAAGSHDRLLVLLTDPLSGIITKGSVVPRYYNPGNVFREVHFLLLNEDHPDPERLKFMVGEANAFVHNLPLPPRFFVRSLGWQPIAMGRLIRQTAEIAISVRPGLIRAYCAGINALLANHVGRQLGIPSLVSVHSRPDFWIASGLKQSLRERAIAALADRVVRGAGNTLAIYQPQLPYFRRLGVEPHLIHNVIAGKEVPYKKTYAIDGQLKLISVGRQMPGKDIANLLGAVAMLPGVELTVVGDGPTHASQVRRAEELGLRARCRFIRTWDNSDLCDNLQSYDAFAAHSIYPETPKAVMEPMLAGLPVIMNRNRGDYESELENAAWLVEDTVEGYRTALAALFSSEPHRRDLGLACLRRALAVWEPVATEAKHAELHARLAR